MTACLPIHLPDSKLFRTFAVNVIGMQTKNQGLMGGLKRILFNPDEAPAEAVVATAPTRTPQPAAPERDDRTMEKVRKALDQMNKPGVDFMEVWRAAAEMGGATPQNLRAAFTSLRFADPTLDKRKVLETGAGYVSALREALSAEARKRADERLSLESERDKRQSQLDIDIKALSDQVESLTQQLRAKRAERDGLHDAYATKISEIDLKISSGQASVDAVVADMEDVLRSVEAGIP